MIEPNLVKWLDLGDNMQKSDIYLKGSFLVLFRFFVASSNESPK